MEGTAIGIHHSDWILALLLVASVLLLVARLYDPGRFRAFASLPFHVKRQEMEQNFSASIRKGGFDLSLSLVSYVILALAIYIVLYPPAGGISPSLRDWGAFLRLFFVTTLFFVTKDLVGLSVGYIFNSIEMVARGQNVGLAYRSWLALWLVPLCMLVVYSGEAYGILYYVLAVVLVLGYFFALQFSVARLWKLPAASYYKFFYLCALEITPLLFFLAWLQSLYQ